MEVEIIFISSCCAKKIQVEDMYIKGDFLCLQLSDGYIVRYPMCNIFQVASKHCKHIGTSRVENGLLLEKEEKDGL